MSDADGSFTLLPRWRQAIADYFAAQFKDGDIVSHAWLEEHFGLEALGDDSKLTAQDFKERQFKWLACIENFKRELLEQHQIFLASVHGEGYRVTPPAEQTAIAAEKYETEAKRSYRTAALRLKNVRLTELTDDQRRENMDAIVKLSMLRGMQKTALE